MQHLKPQKIAADAADLAGENRMLRRAVHDLVSLAALPAEWIERDPYKIANSIAALLVSTLSLEVVYVRIPRENGVTTEARGLDRWPAVAEWLHQSGFDRGEAVSSPNGRVTLTTDKGSLCLSVTPVAANAPGGLIVAGARRPEFPTELDTVLLSVAANQAMIASQTADILNRAARAQAEVRRNEEARLKLAAIVESSDDAIVSKDLNGIVMSWNAAAERMFGYTAEEMIGTPILRIIPPELQSQEDHILSELRAGRRVDHFETERVTKWGERIAVSLTISPVKDERGVVIGAAKIARDITERRKAEQALRTSEKIASVGRLAATVAHEINNPLEAIVNLVYLARNDPATPAAVEDYLRSAEEELERVSQLTRQTLGFYRERKHVTSLRVGTILRELLAVFSSKMANKSITSRLDVESDPEIAAVGGDLRQLFANLLSNSIDAIGESGTIRMRVSRARRWGAGGHEGVRISVADTGHGIDAADRSRLFEPFFTAKKEVGTGLGLWVSKGIVEAHGGTITVRSCAIPGKSWTVISVFLPVEAAHALGRSDAASAQPAA